jgi:hypothetical protein
MIQPELLVLPLRMAVKVYSGIAPPPALLHALAAAPPTQIRPQMSAFPSNLHPQAITPKSSTPVTPSYSTPSPQPGYFGAPPIPDDAPPSYEDAMAEDIAPVDGPRRDYNPPVNPENSGSTGFGSDSKRSSESRPLSERLFPESTGFSGTSRDSSFDRPVDTPGTQQDGQQGCGQVPVSPIHGSPTTPGGVGVAHSDSMVKRRMSGQPGPATQ